MDELMRPPVEETKRRWQKLEEDTAESLYGWKTTGSGNKGDKGDAKSYLFRVECKYRWEWKEPFGFVLPLDLQWLEAIWRHAMNTKKIPMLVVEWGDGERACLLPEDYYKSYIEEAAVPLVEIELRIPHIPSIPFSSCTHMFHFTSIEIPESKWVLFPWEDLSWLRIAELKEREQIGKDHARSIAAKKPWATKSFSKRSWK